MDAFLKTYNTPHVTIAIPFMTCVLPSPTVSGFSKNPGNTEFPEAFILGSMTSFTGMILVSSPGRGYIKFYVFKPIITQEQFYEFLFIDL